MDEALQKQKIFDADGLCQGNCDGKGKLRFWTPELCAQYPHLFDFVVTVLKTNDKYANQSLVEMALFYIRAGCFKE